MICSGACIVSMKYAIKYCVVSTRRRKEKGEKNLPSCSARIQSAYHAGEYAAISIDKTVYSALSLSTRVYKWIPANDKVQSNLIMD